MVELTIDGHTVQMPEGSMVMHAIEKLSKYVPHFCYHKKLSIAANCRMCLVEVEKAPKPLPACATPVSQGMIIHTTSVKAKAAQESVMEFMLINHPLDCPVCDQGGECQLQDLAVGYGKDQSRYAEEKRMVDIKEAGSLISMQEMSRCIHCTRCVRFGQEVAGVMELGMLNRGEHSEITTFLGQSINSELSGNMIDLCPVGALTSKPFRYKARTWELSRRKAISVHDSLGSNLTVHVKSGKVMRVLPLDNESINECWISDRDRFAYEGLNSADRLTEPMIKRGSVWEVASWEDALLEAQSILIQSGANTTALVHAMSSLEELYGLKNIISSLGSNAIQFNLRRSSAQIDINSIRMGVPWLGLPIDQLSKVDAAFIIGSFLRKDQPLLAARLRSAAKRGACIMSLHSVDDDLLMPMAAKMVVKPSLIVHALLEIAIEVANIKQVSLSIPNNICITPSEIAKKIANSLCGRTNAVIWLGQFALNHSDSADIAVLAQFIANNTNAILGHLVQESNAVGAYALKLNVNLNTQASSKINVLYNLEPALDCSILPSFEEKTVAFTAFRSAVESHATVMLPITPSTESGGTYINIEGKIQFMHPSTKPLIHSKPGWKVLKVLGNALQASGFSYDTLEEAKSLAIESIGDLSTLLNNAVKDDRLKNIELNTQPCSTSLNTLERIVDIPSYSCDAIVRRASSLQATQASNPPTANLNQMTLNRLNLHNKHIAKISSATGFEELVLEVNNAIPNDCIAISAARIETVNLGNQNLLTVEAV